MIDQLPVRRDICETRAGGKIGRLPHGNEEQCKSKWDAVAGRLAVADDVLPEHSECRVLMELNQLNCYEVLYTVEYMC